MSFKRARNVLLPLRGALMLARKAGHITTNPLYGWQADDLNEPENSGRKIEPFSPSEIKAIVDAADGAIRNLIQFAFWTGLRTSELIAVRWEDIKGETLHVC